jgi:hypothetical protein
MSAIMLDPSSASMIADNTSNAETKAIMKNYIAARKLNQSTGELPCVAIR